MPLKDPYGIQQDVAPVVTTMADVKKSWYTVEEFEPIAAGESRTVSVSLVSGILNSGWMWPLWAANLTLELLLVVDPAAVCESSVAADGPGGVAAVARSQDWSIDNFRGSDFWSKGRPPKVSRNKIKNRVADFYPKIDCIQF